METFEQIAENKKTEIVSIGNWMITILLTCIPIVNFIMLLVWAFSGNTHLSKANWAKATLIFMLIWIVLFIAFWGSIMAALVAHNAMQP